MVRDHRSPIFALQTPFFTFFFALFTFINTWPSVVGRYSWWFLFRNSENSLSTTYVLVSIVFKYLLTNIFSESLYNVFFLVIEFCHTMAVFLSNEGNCVSNYRYRIQCLSTLTRYSKAEETNPREYRCFISSLWRGIRADAHIRLCDRQLKKCVNLFHYTRRYLEKKKKYSFVEKVLNQNPNNQ